MRCLSWLHILALVAPLFFGLVAAADTSDVPDQATNVPTLRADEAGSKTVNPQTGAASYSYSFKLPPARGVGPTLGLHYSSNGPMRGTIAYGWTLDIPEIRRNVLLEVAGTVTDPNPAITMGKAYEVSLGGQVQRLVQVSDPAPSSGAKAFRARFDASLVRYEKTPAAWRAYTSDGTTFYFETSVGEWWVLTRVVDRHAGHL
jgi:hypothetical protein